MTDEMLAEQNGMCEFFGCTTASMRDAELCLHHAYAEDDRDEFRSAKPIYLFTLTCVFCSWSTWAKGTAQQYRVTMLFGNMRCPKCSRMIEITRERFIVGREYGTGATDS
jgi:hypothetical protein